MTDLERIRPLIEEAERYREEMQLKRWVSALEKIGLWIVLISGCLLVWVQIVNAVRRLW
jgi:hypothetical protein